MPLPAEQNRRLEPKKVYSSKFYIFCLIILIILLFLFGSFGFSHLLYNSNKNISTSETIHQNSLTLEQIETLEKLKESLSGNLTHEYMKRNEFLIQWLKEKNWNLEDTITMFLEHLEWRKEYKIDGILNEDFSESRQEFPVYTDAVDRQGRPVFTSMIADWDLRKAALAGRGKKYLRYVYYLYETMFKMIRDAQSQGRNVTQVVFIYNLESFSMVKHGCYHCVPYWMKTIFGLQDNYPGIIYRILLINTPEEFSFLLDLAPSDLQKVWEVYNSNKSVWKKAVLDLISPEQIRVEFGGTKRSDSD